jgi:CRP-like cAMP-binding protein
MASIQHSSNQLLAALPVADFELLRPHLRTIELVNGDVLVEAGTALSNVYFPHSGIISSVVNFAEGETAEVAMFGCEGVFGASNALRGADSSTAAIVRFPGKASTINAADFCAMWEQIASLREVLTQYQWIQISQAEQSVACNASHNIGARLCRQLLRSHDLAHSDTLPLTQEILAQMLGVQRNTVSLIAHELQQAGIIGDSRGQIIITDLSGLMACSCECYKAGKPQQNAQAQEYAISSPQLIRLD